MPPPWPIVLLLLLLSGCAGGAVPPTKNEVIAHTLATTVQVVTERPDGMRRSGSAVLLGSEPDRDRTIVLTTHHLLAPVVEQDIRVRFPSGSREVEATLLAVDADRDLALLATPGTEPDAAWLQADVYLGDQVWVVAFPWGRQRTVVNGVVSQVAWPESATPEVVPIAGSVRLIDASVSYGMSGGGVFEANDGALVGIVRGYRTAQLALPGFDTNAVRLPVAGETTVISAKEIGCFLSAAGFAGIGAGGTC
jgi:S1-C subfamily serine protease